MIEDAFTYPTNHDNWIKTVIIGGVLTFFGFLLLPIFIVQGYVIRVMRTTIAGESSPPEFGDWGTLLVEGLKAWVIGVVYMLVPLIVAFVTVGGSMGAMMTGGRMGSAVGAAGMLGGLAVTTVLMVVFGYFAVAAIVLFAREGEFGAAFDFEQLRAVALNTDYAISWLVSVAVFIVAGIVTGIPVIGFVVGPFVSFYALVVAGRLWSGGYLEAVGSEADTSPSVGEEHTGV